MHRSRRDLARRQLWLFASPEGVATSDMDIILDDGRVVPVHKAILAGASEPFRVLLGMQFEGSLLASSTRNVIRGATYQPGSSESRPRLALKGVSLHAMASLLRFLYTGTVALDRHTAIDVLLASEKFSLHSLRSLTELHMPRVLCDDNACSILTAAVDARASGLVAYTTSFILRHLDGILDTPGFAKLPRPLLSSLLAHDDACVTSEERLLKAVLRWGVSNLPTSSRQYAGIEDGQPATQHMKGGLFPSIAASAVPSLRAVLAELCPVLRFAHLDVHVLKSPAVSALVASNITLAALFEKITVDQEVAAVEHSRVAADLSHGSARVINIDIGSDAPISVSAHGPASPSKAGSFMASLDSRHSLGLLGGSQVSARGRQPGGGFLSATRQQRPSIIAGDMMLDIEGSSGLSVLGGVGTGGSSSQQQNSGGLIRRQMTAATAYLSSGLAPDVPLPSDMMMASSHQGTGQYEAPTLNSLVMAGMDAESARAMLLPGGGVMNGVSGPGANGRTADGKSRRRRYAELRCNPFLAARLHPHVPTVVTFEPHHSPDVALSNGGRTVSLPSASAAWQGSAAASRDSRSIGPGNGSEGDAGATLFAGLPCIEVGRASGDGLLSPLSDTAVSGPLPSLLPPGRLSWEIVIEDSETLLDVDPEGGVYEQADVRATVRALEGGVMLPTLPSAGLGTAGMKQLTAALVTPLARVQGGAGMLVTGQPHISAGYSTNGYPANGMGMPYGMGPMPVSLPQPLAVGSIPPDQVIRPFEIAVCLVPAGAVHQSAALGRLRSSQPADHGVLWMATNRGHVYARTAPATPVLESEGSSTPTPETPAGADCPTPLAVPGPLTLQAVGLPWAVASYLRLAVDSITGDVGLSLSNARAGFEEDEEDEEGALCSLDDLAGSGLGGSILEAAFGQAAIAAQKQRRRSYSSNSGMNALLPPSELIPPRAPPPAFSLLPTADPRVQDAAARVLHTPDPSLSVKAKLHAVVCRVPLALALYGADGVGSGPGAGTRGVQIAILARSSAGLVVTLLPPADPAN